MGWRARVDPSQFDPQDWARRQENRGPWSKSKKHENTAIGNFSKQSYIPGAIDRFLKESLSIVN